jgi:hypothetical protein
MFKSDSRSGKKIINSLLKEKAFGQTFLGFDKPLIINMFFNHNDLNYYIKECIKDRTMSIVNEMFCDAMFTMEVMKSLLQGLASV